MSTLPPMGRTPLWQPVTEGAALLAHLQPEFILCGAVQYPPREVCGTCLSDALTWRPQDGLGKVIAATALHASMEPYFQARLPVRVALVRLNAGPVVYAFNEDDLKPGAAARITARIDDSGQAVLHVKKEQPR
jgi:uncharacterized OB-fold protein